MCILWAPEVARRGWSAMDFVGSQVATASTRASDLRRWPSTSRAILRQKVRWPNTVNYSRDETPIMKVHAADAVVRRSCPPIVAMLTSPALAQAMPPSLGFPAPHSEFAGILPDSEFARR